MWTIEKPILTGYYWFYGDPFWGYSYHNEELNINPFIPKFCIIEVKNNRNKVSYLYNGAFCYEMKGVWYDKMIPTPDSPDLSIFNL